MEAMKRLGIGLRMGFAMALVLAGLVSALGVSPAAAATATVKCEVMENAKTEIKHVANAEACKKMGGKVVPAKKSHKKSAPPAPSGSGTAPPQ